LRQEEEKVLTFQIEEKNGQIKTVYVICGGKRRRKGEPQKKVDKFVGMGEGGKALRKRRIIKREGASP